MDKITQEMLNLFYDVILELDNKEDCINLINDLLTKQEIDKCAQRVMAAKLLLDGNTYDKVIKQTNISSATLSRVSNCTKYGRGYNNSKILNINKGLS